MGRNRWPSVFELEHRCARRRRRRGTTVSSTPVVLVALAILTTACAAAPPPQTPSFPGSPSWSALSRLSEGEKHHHWPALGGEGSRNRGRRALRIVSEVR